MFMYRKRRRKKDCHFGFVRFKSLEEASNVVRNPNGAMIRGKSLKVSFAKYDKNGTPLNVSASMAAKQVSKVAGIEGNDRKVTNRGRSFKEVVKGLTHLLEADDRTRRNSRYVDKSGVDMFRMELDEMILKKMVWRVVDENFKTINLEQLKLKLGALIEEAIN